MKFQEQIPSGGPVLEQDFIWVLFGNKCRGQLVLFIKRVSRKVIGSHCGGEYLK